MSDKEFRALLNLMMCADPWPAGRSDHDALRGFVSRSARARGFDDWVDAYHRFLPEKEQA